MLVDCSDEFTVMILNCSLNLRIRTISIFTATIKSGMYQGPHIIFSENFVIFIISVNSLFHWKELRKAWL